MFVAYIVIKISFILYILVIELSICIKKEFKKRLEVIYEFKKIRRRLFKWQD